jgi:hypothetical protein
MMMMMMITTVGRACWHAQYNSRLYVGCCWQFLNVLSCSACHAALGLTATMPLLQSKSNYHAVFSCKCCTSQPHSLSTAGRSALSPLHPELPVLLVVMATRRRDIAFPHIDIVAAQQRAVQLPGLFKLEMTGFEFYPVDVGVPGGEAQLVHLTKAGCAALGVALGYMVASKGGL